MKNRALLVWPRFPKTFWGFNQILDFGLSTARPPLGLLTVAALFPANWELKLIDMNVPVVRDQLRELTPEDLNWVKSADYGAVFISAMTVQQKSMYEVLSMCAGAGTPTVVGGPYATSYHEEIANDTNGSVSHFLLGEVEQTFANFLNEFLNNRAEYLYPEPPKPSLEHTPLPRYDLIDFKDYITAAVQFTRGCPFDCEFCDITKLYGRIPRTKKTAQVLAELQNLYDLGYRGTVEFVDDNFIGNKRDAVKILGTIAEWQTQRNYPFKFSTEASMNIVDIDKVLSEMRRAGFDNIFTGIESVSLKALARMKKVQNMTHTEGGQKGEERDIVADIHHVQRHGISVHAGFILGLDGDDGSVFDTLPKFIQRAGIPVAMVGLLQVIKQTNLFKRLFSEGRLYSATVPSGNNVSINGALNFVPELERGAIITGFKKVLSALYQPTLESYFERCLKLYGKQAKPIVDTKARNMFKLREIVAGVRSVTYLMRGPTGPYYRRFLLQVLFNFPAKIGTAIAHGMIGHHLRWMTQQIVCADDLAREAVEVSKLPLDMARKRIALVEARYHEIHLDFREHVDDALNALRAKLEVGREFIGV
jgi:radical SAM superfamily enzyme YgiQ (UPF0313 family)